MNIPGANLLKIAFTVIAQQTVGYLKATGRTVNAVQQQVTTYASSVLIKGSFQPVPRSLYEVNGLDFQKVYYTFYSSMNIIDIQRDVSADQITFNSATYQVLSSNDWFAVDGWKGVLCVLVTGAAN